MSEAVECDQKQRKTKLRYIVASCICAWSASNHKSFFQTLFQDNFTSISLYFSSISLNFTLVSAHLYHVCVQQTWLAMYHCRLSCTFVVLTPTSSVAAMLSSMENLTMSLSRFASVLCCEISNAHIFDLSRSNSNLSYVDGA